MSRMNVASGKYPKAKKLVLKGIRENSRAAKLRKGAVKKGLIESKASKAQKIAARLALKADPSLRNVKVTPRQELAVEARENASGKA